MHRPVGDSPDDDFDRDAALQEMLTRWEDSVGQGNELSVEQLCGDHPECQEELAARIAERKRRHADSGSAAEPPNSEVELPEAIGDYRVIRQLGRGGSATVYLCEQKRPNRMVALKLLQTSDLGPRRQRRFQLEIELLGSLQHPGIAQIFDADVARVGGVSLPFFTMEWVSGERLDRYAQRARDGGDSPERMLSLFRQICAAVHYAHSLGVVHRDLKPTNVLVGVEGRAKVIDFGIARLLPNEVGTSRGETATIGLVGSPPYMSPEQFDEDAASVTAKSDQYSLAVVLYEMLTGELPYPIEGLPLVKAADLIRNRPPTPISHWDRRIDAGVAIVLEKALAKRPDERYASVHEFSEDLRRAAEGVPIEARRQGPLVQVRSLGRRYPRWSAAMVTAALMVLVGFVAACTLAIVNMRQTDRLEAAAVQLTEERNRSLHNERLLRQRGAALERTQEELGETVRDLARAVCNSRVARANDLADSDCDKALSLLLNDVACPPAMRGFAWQLARKNATRQRASFPAHEGPIHSVSVGATGSRVATTGDGHIRFWETSSGKRLFNLEEMIGPSSDSALDDSARQLVVLKQNGKVILIDTQAIKKRLVYDASKGPATAIAISPNGKELAIAIEGGELWIWTSGVDVGPETLVVDGTIRSLRFGDDHRLALVLRSGQSNVIDLRTGDVQTRRKFASATSRYVVWGPDLRHIGMARTFTGVSVFDSVSSHELHWNGGAGADPAIGILDDQRRRFLLCRRKLIEIFEGGSRVVCLKATDSPVARLGLNSDATIAAVAMRDGTVSVLDLQLGYAADLVADQSPLNRVRFGHSSRRLACSGGDGVIEVRSLAEDIPTVRLAGHQTPVTGFHFLKEQTKLVSIDAAGVIRIWDVLSGRLERSYRHAEERVVRFVVGPDQRTVYAGAKSGSVHAFGLQTGVWERFSETLAGGITAIAISDDGRRLFAGCEAGEIACWDLTKNELQSRSARSGHRVTELSLSADGETLACGLRDGRIEILDARTLRSVRTLRLHPGGVTGVDFHPTEPLLASVGVAGDVVLWDAVNWDQQAVLNAINAGLNDVEFSPDGKKLVVVGESSGIRLFEVP